MSRASRQKPLSAASPPLSPLPPPSRDLKGVQRLIFPLLLLAYIGLACWHASIVPTGATGYQNAPDEAAHAAYVHMIAHGHLPTRADGLHNPAGYEWHQPPLYYALAACFLGLGERGLRGASILCGLLSLLVIYRAARLLFPNDPMLAVLAGGIAALTPTHVAITSTVNNDPLLELCFGAALLLLLFSFHGGFTLWRAGWLGAAIGAAMLTKATGLLLLPVVLFALLLLRKTGESRPALLRGTAWMGLVAFAVCGWWYIRNAVLYGELLPLKAFNESFAGTMQASQVAERVGGWGNYLFLMAQMIFQSFWAVYGTAKTARVGAPLFLPDQLYLLFAIVCAISLFGLARLHFKSRTEMTETQRFGVWILFAALGLVAASFLAFILKYFQAQGRYLYPAMLPICVLTALGWRAAVPTKYGALATGLLFALLGAAALAFFRYIT